MARWLLVFVLSIVPLTGVCFPAFGQGNSSAGINFNNDTGLVASFNVCCPGANQCRSGNHEPDERFSSSLCRGAVTALSIVLPNGEIEDCAVDVVVTTWVDLNVSAACRSVLRRHNVSARGGGEVDRRTQSGAICGQAMVVVINRHTGAAIENAPVYINGKSLVGHTSSQGGFSVFSRCEDPVESITVASRGFKSKTVRVGDLSNAPEFKFVLERISR